MKKEFLVERQGRIFCLYAGLLDLSHQQGLKSIHTELLQIPSEGNNRVAIAKATVILERDGVERVFTGIGDAALNNVAPAMQTCLIRMAETRAKARALRDAVNIGVAAFEELGDEDVQDSAPERGYQVSSGKSIRSERSAPTTRTNALERHNGNGTNGGRAAAAKADKPAPIPAEMRNPAANPLTDDQANALRNLCRRQGLEIEAVVKEKFGLDTLTEMTQAQAGDLIRTLSAQANGRTTTTA